MSLRPQHPSGRPIRDNKPKGQPIWRAPLDGYVTPRLQGRTTDAVGFVHKFSRDEEYDICGHKK